MSGSLGLQPRRVARNAAWQGLASLIGAATKALAAVAVGRTLGPSGLGVFSGVWTVAATLSVFAVLGLDLHLIRETSRRGDGDGLGETLPLAVLLGLAFAGALAAAALVAGARTAVGASLAAGAVYVALSAPLLVFVASFHARERMELETAVLTVEAVAGLLSIACALAARLGAAGVIGGLAAGRAAALFWARRLAGRPRWLVRPDAWGSALRAGIPMGAAYALTSVVVRLDVVMVAALRPSAEAGLYGAASAVCVAVPMASVALSRALYPALSRSSGAHDPELSRVLSRVWTVLLPAGLGAALGIATLSRTILVAGFGARFGEAAGMLAILASVIPLRFANTQLATTLNAVGLQRRRVVAAAAAAAFNVGCNVVAIPLAGAWGAVASTLATEAGLCVLLGWALGGSVVRSSLSVRARLGVGLA